MFGRLLPKETSFFDFIEEHAALTVDGAQEFVSLVSSSANIDVKAGRIKEIEHETDVITHRCVEALHKTLITPIDPDNIHRLITRMDDVMDFIEAASERIALYELTVMTPEVKDLADVLTRASSEMLEVCKLLSTTPCSAFRAFEPLLRTRGLSTSRRHTLGGSTEPTRDGSGGCLASQKCSQQVANHRDDLLARARLGICLVLLHALFSTSDRVTHAVDLRLRHLTPEDSQCRRSPISDRGMHSGFGR